MCVCVCVCVCVGTLHVLDRSTYALLRSLSVGPDPVHCVALNPALRLVVCGSSLGRVSAFHVEELGLRNPSTDALALPSARPQGSSLKRRREEAPVPDAAVSSLPPLSLSPSPAALSPHVQGASGWADFTGHGDKHGLGGGLGGLGGGFYNLLSAFGGIPTISGSTAFHEPCWQVC
jgi:hypothetical protein